LTRLASAPENHAAQLIAQPSDFVGVRGATEAPGQVEEFLLLALLIRRPVLDELTSIIIADYASGLRHFKPGNRWKSRSEEQSSARCSNANAARCASDVRLPPVPRGSKSSRRIAPCLGPGWTMLTQVSSQKSIRSKAVPMRSGSRKRPGRVVRRRNASKTVHGIPIVAVPERLSPAKTSP
jgi:hypothetical protein